MDITQSSFFVVCFFLEVLFFKDRRFIQGLVVSLCLDKNVWDAIKNNGIVEKLQELPSSGL